MYNRPLVRPDFVVPDRIQLDGLKLCMLSIDDVERDFEAVVASETRLKGLFDRDSPWPVGLTIRENLVDLGWHEREFTLRKSFAYSVTALADNRYLGCCYIFPSNVAGYDASVFYWVRAAADADVRDAHLGAQLKVWLRETWPFQHVAFPGRDRQKPLPQS